MLQQNHCILILFSNNAQVLIHMSVKLDKLYLYLNCTKNKNCHLNVKFFFHKGFVTLSTPSVLHLSPQQWR